MNRLFTPLYLRNVWGRNSEILAFGCGRRPVYETRHHAISTPNRCIWRELGLGAEGRADCPRPRSGLNTPIDRFFNLHITPTPKINQSTPSPTSLGGTPHNQLILLDIAMHSLAKNGTLEEQQ